MNNQDLNMQRFNRLLKHISLLDLKRQRWVMSAVARKVDSLNRKRVMNQVMLEGDKFKGRKLEVRKKMFQEIKKRKNIVIDVRNKSATIKHKGRLQRIAAEHHFGAEIKLPQQQRSDTISSGRRNIVLGDDPCTHQQAGIILSFLALQGDDLEPACNVKQAKIERIKAQNYSQGGRAMRTATIDHVRKKYTAAEAGHAIAKWDETVSRKHSVKTSYKLPERHLLGIAPSDIPDLMKYTEQRLMTYLMTS